MRTRISYVLTEKGKAEVKHFLNECRAFKKEILDAGIDTCDETELPSEEDILCDIAQFIDEDGDYYNSWGVTDHHDLSICLQVNKDFFISLQN